MGKTNEKQKKSVGEEIGGDVGGGVDRISNLIYRVRGREVTMDADLARIYGYETKVLNRQVKRNIEKFEGEDFMFQLTWEELNMILRCQNGTSNMRNCLRCQNGTLDVGGGFLRSQIVTSNEDDFSRSQNVTLNDNFVSRSKKLTLKETSRGGNIKYLPYVFTEQGVYMLMTVLKGELAVKQSRALVMAFKAMKDYILENRVLLDQREQLKMMALGLG